MQISTLAEASQYLARFYENTRSPYTLDNMHQLMESLGNPQDRFKVVHIAGTSGKTSTAYYMAALLTASGKKVGLTVSPHVDSLTERLQINGQPVSGAVFCQALNEFLIAIQDVTVKPSWFEVMVSFAYWYFAREQVDYAVVEVGLGGLLDGTNVISRADKLCLITDIGLDHTDVLGTNLTDIAAQKIGIVQSHNQTLTHPQTPAVMRVFEKWCRQQDAVVRIIKSEPAGDTSMPAYQVRNWQLAYAGYQHLEKRDGLPHLTSQALAQTKHINIPGRMDTRHLHGKTIIMDGAHNQQKMNAFLGSFRRQYPDTKPAVLLALKEGKEYQEIIPLLKPFAGRLIITGFEANQDVPLRSMDPGVLSKAFETAGKLTELIGDPVEAYRSLLSSPEPVLVITGSFYLLSQIRNNEAII
jgi:dihydrofolate synthase / folylpolyglutamate synthase